MNYWKKGCNHLLKCDPVFKKYYNPKHQLKTNKNKFDVLFKSICSQQISVSAAMSIYKNSKHIIGPVNFTNFRNNKNKIKFIEILFEVCEQEKTTLLMVSHDTSLIKHFDDNYLLENLNKVL